MATLRARRPLELQAELLDKREMKFAQGLQKATTGLFSDLFLKELPSSMQWMPVPVDDLADKTRVFIEVLKDGVGSYKKLI